MANTLQISLEVNTKGEATIKQVTGDLERMTRTVKEGARDQQSALTTLRQHWLAVTAATAGAAVALNQVWAAAKRGAEFEETQGRLNRQLAAFGTTADAVLPKIQRLVDGQLSLEESARLTSRALAAGILTPQQIGTFVQLAEILSDIQGGGIAEAFDELQRSLMGGRSAALKSLGIYLDLDQEIEALARATRRHAQDISEEEKALIRRNAVLRESGAVLKEHAQDVASDADKLQAWQAEYDDATLALSRFANAALQATAKLFAPESGALRMFNPLSLVTNYRMAVAHFQAALDGPPKAGPQAPAPPETLAQPTKLELAQKQAVETASRHAAAVDDVRRALVGYARAVELGKDRTQLLNQELTRQQSLLQSVKEQLAVERDESFARGLRDLSPEEQLQALRRKFHELSTQDGPEAVAALRRIRGQVDALGQTEGAEQLARLIQERLITVLERLERAAVAAKDATITGLQEQAAEMAKLREQAEGTKRILAEFQLKYEGDQELIDALQKIQEEARQTQRELANIRIPSGGGGGPAVNMPAGDLAGSFASGTTRIPRTGLARLHYGEAVIPREMNFLDPSLSRMEREQRLARLAAGRIPSFELGTPVFQSPGTGIGSAHFLDFLADLPLLRTGGRALFPGRPRSAERLVEFLEDKLQELEDSWNIFVNRVTGENAPHGMATFFLAPAQWMTAFNSLTGLREQISQQLAAARGTGGDRVPGLGGASGGAGGVDVQGLLAEGRLVLEVNVVLDGRTITRQSIVPELRALKLASGGAF